MPQPNFGTHVVDRFTGRTVEEARRTLTSALNSGGVASAELDARLLVGEALELDFTGLIAAAGRRLNAEEAQRLEEFTQRRLEGEPVAHILGVKEFWGLPLRLSSATLVPRPDTETVVELALDIWRGEQRRIVDIGTGSGAILLALLSEWREATGIGTDISSMALQTARLNAGRL